MNLSKLTSTVKNKKAKRVGRGTGSGHGKTSTRGNKGAGSREGKKIPYIGFNGGNIPYIRRMPKRGFTSMTTAANEYQIVNLGDIAKRIKDVKEITPQVLKQNDLIKDENRLVKILATTGEYFSLKALFKADKFSKKASLLIEKVGGKIECLKR